MEDYQKAGTIKFKKNRFGHTKSYKLAKIIPLKYEHTQIFKIYCSTAYTNIVFGDK